PDLHEHFRGTARNRKHLMMLRDPIAFIAQTIRKLRELCRRTKRGSCRFAFIDRRVIQNIQDGHTSAPPLTLYSSSYHLNTKKKLITLVKWKPATPAGAVTERREPKTLQAKERSHSFAKPELCES